MPPVHLKFSVHSLYLPLHLAMSEMHPWDQRKDGHVTVTM